MPAPSPPPKAIFAGLLPALACVGMGVAVSIVVRQLLYPALLALAFAAAGLLLRALRRRGTSLVGPLFFYDVLRLARRGRGTALRALYGVALLVALAVVYAQRFPQHDLLALSDDGGPYVSLHQQARFAQTFATTLLLLQNVAVLALTPAYLAGAVAEEKEKKTLALLFTTALTDREIVLGKMLGRLAHIGGVLLVGLPVLSLAQLWGGVDVRVLLAGFAVTALTLLSVGAICLFCSVTANTVLSATVGAYVASALLGFGCLCQGGGFAFSPISFVVELDKKTSHGDDPAASSPSPSAGAGGAGADDLGAVALEMVTYYAIVHGAIAFFGVAWAVSQLRPSDERLMGPRPADPLPAGEGPPRLPSATDLAEAAGIYRPSPPVGDDGLFWKEVLQGSGREAPRLRRELAIPATVAVIAAVALWVAVGLQSMSDPPGWPATRWRDATRDIINPMVRVCAAILLTVACLGVGFRAAGCVSRERDRRTLDGLLALPLTRADVLWAKWLGSVLRTRHLLYWLVVVWCVGVCTGALHPLAVPLVALTAAAHVAFIASLGVWVSLAARSTLWANFMMALLLLLFFAAGWLGWLWTGAPLTGDLDVTTGFFLIGLTPWRAWSALSFPLAGAETTKQGEADYFALLMAVAGGVYFAAAAAAFWAVALRRFRREQGKGA